MNMKLKCRDGKVRIFKVVTPHWRGIGLEEAECMHCHYPFGCHDTDILKPMFKNHICKFRCNECGWEGTDCSCNDFGESRCPNCDSGNELIGV